MTCEARPEFWQISLLRLTADFSLAVKGNDRESGQLIYTSKVRHQVERDCSFCQESIIMLSDLNFISGTKLWVKPQLCPVIYIWKRAGNRKELRVEWGVVWLMLNKDGADGLVCSAFILIFLSFRFLASEQWTVHSHWGTISTDLVIWDGYLYCGFLRFAEVNRQPVIRTYAMFMSHAVISTWSVNGGQRGICPPITSQY